MGGGTDAYEGFQIIQGRGIAAAFDLPDPPEVTALNPPGGWIAYTPTAMPHGRSCIEITGIHVQDHTRGDTGGPYNDAFGIWDWCNVGPEGDYTYRYQANSTNYSFRDPYVRSYTDEFGLTKKYYFIQAWAHNAQAASGDYDCWEGDIYNFNLGQWEEKWTSCGIASHHSDANGWVMHETRYLASGCYTMKTIGAQYLKALLR